MITKLLSKIKNYLFTSKANIIIPENKMIDVQIGDEKIKMSISINNNTIFIESPLNIVLNSNIFAVKTNFGVHLNPSSTNCEELERVYLQHQNVIEHTTEKINSKLPYKLKVKRFNRFLKGY